MFDNSDSYFTISGGDSFYARCEVEDYIDSLENEIMITIKEEFAI
jgi:hypothetical protein